jgi:glutathione synthase/RimK-type ligase-like ATP-grasp enzyme
MPFRSVVRLGSTTVKEGDEGLVECNSAEAIRNSANKLRMKRCFKDAGVVTAKYDNLEAFNVLTTGQRTEQYPIVIKSHTGSRGRGNYLIQTEDEYKEWFDTKPSAITNYIFEKFHDYVREYRLHVTKEGCFYTNRKMLRSETPKDKRWYRNDSNCTWILESNPDFDKPSNWNDIVSECVKALKAVGLDVGACDVKVQSSKDKNGKKRANPEFIVIEINSAASHGDVTRVKYLEIIPQILQKKAKK